jgi:hypothetical protein
MFVSHLEMRPNASAFASALPGFLSVSLADLASESATKPVEIAFATESETQSIHPVPELDVASASPCSTPILQKLYINKHGSNNIMFVSHLEMRPNASAFASALPGFLSVSLADLASESATEPVEISLATESETQSIHPVPELDVASASPCSTPILPK